MSPARFRLETDDGDTLVVLGDRIADPGTRCDAVIRLGPGRIRPGLINAHEHLQWNHYPRLGRPPYRNLYEWAEDLQTRFAGEAARYAALPAREAVLFGALKNLLGGVTTVVHHGGWRDEFGQGFPVRVERLRTIHSLRLEPDLEAALRSEPSQSGHPLCMHLAEGLGAELAHEVFEAAELGLLTDRLLAVHLVAADPPGIDLLREAGSGFVWCPTSNLHLYGRTASPELFDSGIDVLLGTDALISGDGTLLDELGAARRLRLLDDRRLEDAVGVVAARRLGRAAPSLAPGAPANLAVLRRPLLEARPRDVALVLVGGSPRYGDATFAELFARAGVPAERLDVAGTPKLVAAPLATVARKVFRLSPACRRIVE